MNKHTYEVDINKANFDIMTCKLDMTEDETNFILEYRDKFKLLEGDGSALVNLEELWEALDCPRFTHSVHVGKTADKYKRAKSQAFSEWFNEVALPTLERLNTQICVSIQKRPGRGQPKKIRSIDTESAKALAMMANNEAGDTVRRYFITVEKLFKNALEYNIKLIGIEQSRKKVSHNGFKTGGKLKGWDESKRYNRLMAEAIGARHGLETDVNEYAHACKTVERMMLKGCNDDLILAAVA